MRLSGEITTCQGGPLCASAYNNLFSQMQTFTVGQQRKINSTWGHLPMTSQLQRVGWESSWLIGKYWDGSSSVQFLELGLGGGEVAAGQGKSN